MASPKLFISYSWTTPDHEAWVLRLASDLRQSGVDAILDKWDLREGHDAHAFMEKMVTDPEIRKVALVCDGIYVEKADGRSGGVGTETQIISGEVYAKQTQDKFVAIVTERNDEGKPYLPAYYRSRIYIDFSDASTYSDSFDQLLRWIFDQPLHRKPELGTKPFFLSEENRATILATSSRFRRAIDSIKNNRQDTEPAVSEYLNVLAKEMEKLRMGASSGPVDDAVVKSVEEFIPYRNELIELVLTLAVYRDTVETRIAIHRFFEQLIPYMDRPPQISSWRDSDFDNFRFIIHELFLYVLACFIRHERFDSAAYLMSNDYYVPLRLDHGREPMVPFVVFGQHVPSLEIRNQRLQLRRLSVRGDLLKERSSGTGIEFRHLMQADFVLFLRDCLDHSSRGWVWRPETLIWAGDGSGPFEIFARSRSAGYFARARVLLGVETKEDLKALLQKFETPGLVPVWQYQTFSPAHLMGFDQIATKP